MNVNIAMIDLDDFKRINDTFGHAAGDHVLRDVAELIRQHGSPAGGVCRAGGEEFLIAILGEPISARATIGQLCAAIAALPHHVTASIGTTSAVRDGGSTTATSIDELIAVADSAMYAAKRDGGNRVRHA